MMIPEWLSWIDVSFVITLFLLGINGLQQGYARQLAHVISYSLVGLFLLFVYPRLFNFIYVSFTGCDATYLIWAMLLAVVGLGVGVFMLMVWVLVRWFKATATERKDHWLGFIFGMMRGALLLLLAMTYMAILGSPSSREVLTKKSVTGQVVCTYLAPKVQPQLEKGSIGEWSQRAQQRMLKRGERQPLSD